MQVSSDSSFCMLEIGQNVKKYWTLKVTQYKPLTSIKPHTKFESPSSNFLQQMVSKGNFYNRSLCRCSTGADPVTNPTTLGSVTKVVES